MANHRSFWLKLDRAEQHINALEEAIDAFEKNETYRIVRYTNADRTEYYWVAENIPPFPKDWGNLIGDALHNLRASLDHLAFCIALGRMRKRDLLGIQFPIEIDEPTAGFAKATNQSLAGFPQKARALIESLQPYRRVNYAPNALAVLKTWSNDDKHRSLHPVWALVRVEHFGGPVTPAEWDIIDPIFVDQATIFWARFDTPDVDVDFHPSVEIAIPIAMRKKSPTAKQPKRRIVVIGMMPVGTLRGIHNFIRDQVFPPLTPWVTEFDYDDYAE